MSSRQFVLKRGLSMEASQARKANHVVRGIEPDDISPTLGEGRTEK